MKKSSLLFLTTQLPYPPKSGGTIKSWNYLTDLSNRFEVGVACLLKNGDEKLLRSFKHKLKPSTVINEKIEVKRNIWTLLRSYTGFPCLNVFRNHSAAFAKKVKTVSENFEFMMVDHYEMFQYVPNNYSGKVILHTHNAEFMLWQRMSELETNPIKRVLLKKEADRVKQYEMEIFKRSDLIYATPSDIECYRSNGFEVEKHQPTFHLGNEELLKLPDIQFNETELALTFVGTLNWEPNVDGLLWFLNEVWPSVKREVKKTAKLYIIGKNPDERLIHAAKEDQTVVFTGFIENLDDYLKKSRVFIAPLRFGSGMKVKVLDGLYRGLPTVTTSIGAEGLEIVHEKEVMVADEAVGFADSCAKLMQDQILWEKLRTNSRKVAAEKYRWDLLFEQMNASLAKVFNK